MIDLEALKLVISVAAAFACGVLFGTYVAGFLYTTRLMVHAVRNSMIPPSKHFVAAVFIVFSVIFWPVTLRDIEELNGRK